MIKSVYGSIVFVLFTLLFIGCGVEVDEEYVKILFERNGGGSKKFYIATDSTKTLIFDVVEYNFKDTSYTVTGQLYDNGATSDFIADVIAGKVELEGDFEQPTMPTDTTGTWVHIFVVTEEGDLKEITNSAVRDEIIALESYVISSTEQ